MTDIAVSTINLSRHFGAVRAVNDLSLEIPAGTVFGFLGPNGAGKTTTIRLLLGLLEPTHGRAVVLGYDTRKQSSDVRERCSALLEHPGLYERLSAQDNLDFYGRVWHLPSVARQTRIKDLLSHLGLWDRRHETVATWSRGMKQKLAIARALLHRPRLVFLDEPTAGLDPVAGAALREDLAALAAREGVTVFLTTHNMSEAEKLCSLVGVIREGKLLALDHPDRLRGDAASRAEICGSGIDEKIAELLRTRPEVAEVALKNGRLLVEVDHGASVAPLVRFLVEAGVGIEEVRRGRASLEEVFLTLMEEEK